MDLGLAGRCAAVTGGSKGLGFAIAQELLNEGATVAVCARTSDELERAVNHLSAVGPQVIGSVCDVTDSAAVAEFIDSTAASLGGLDILVNNAGGAHPGGFEELTDDHWKADFDVKLMSQIRCVRSALPYLRQSEAARVININAVYARYPDPDFFATSVNRAACHNLTKVLARQYAPEGILVNSINIGFVETPQWANIRDRLAPGSTMDDFFAELVAAEVPLGRFGTAEEVSGIVAFLAGSRSGYITAAAIDVAGGMGKYS